jgi:hypothetical protein
MQIESANHAESTGDAREKSAHSLSQCDSSISSISSDIVRVNLDSLC